MGGVTLQSERRRSMRTTGIKEGDLVECDVRGQRFFARVNSDTNGDRLIKVEPFNVAVGYRSATARQIVGHYRKARGSR